MVSGAVAVSRGLVPANTPVAVAILGCMGIRLLGRRRFSIVAMDYQTAHESAAANPDIGKEIKQVKGQKIGGSTSLVEHDTYADLIEYGKIPDAVV
jgi:hypothetical protein